ncbi:MAG: transposase [Phycisphaerales bacterium]|nr:transposase [Phycisphaerales bacterium]
MPSFGAEPLPRHNPVRWGAYTHILIHLVFSTRDRAPWLTPDIGPRLSAYFHGACESARAPLLIAGGVEDHVHLLRGLHQSVALADAVREIKANSSSWLSRYLPEFAWQSGYAAFSVSRSARDDVRRYIENQAEHHAKRSFKDELRELLQRHGLEFDERDLA